MPVGIAPSCFVALCNAPRKKYPCLRRGTDIYRVGDFLEGLFPAAAQIPVYVGNGH